MKLPIVNKKPLIDAVFFHRYDVVLVVQNEAIKNRLVKGIWRISSMKSSDFIKLIKSVDPHSTGSRIRGVLSSVNHKNYRIATVDDLNSFVKGLAFLFGAKPPLNLRFSDIDLKDLLIRINRIALKAKQGVCVKEDVHELMLSLQTHNNNE